MATLAQSLCRMSVDKSELAERFYASAHAALEEQDDRGALPFFLMVTLLQPRDERGWLGLGVLQERAGRREAANTFYTLGARLVPGSAWCQLGRGRTFSELGNYAEALVAFDAADAATDDPLIARAIHEERP